MAKKMKKKMRFKLRRNEEAREQITRSGSLFLFNSGFKAFKLNKRETLLVRFIQPTWIEQKDVKLEEQVYNSFGIPIVCHSNVGDLRQTFLCYEGITEKYLKNYRYTFQEFLELNGIDFKVPTEPCPICIDRQEALRNGDEEHARDIYRQYKYVAYLIDRKAEGEGVLAWAFPEDKLWKPIMNLKHQDTRKYLYEEDVYSGYDVEISLTYKGYPVYTGVQAVGKGPLSNNERELEEWMEYAIENPVIKAIKLSTMDEIETALLSGGERSVERSERVEEKEETTEEYDINDDDIPGLVSTDDDEDYKEDEDDDGEQYEEDEETDDDEDIKEKEAREKTNRAMSALKTSAQKNRGKK